ncbi:hypothetical protein [Xylanibacillus composti]|uniref:Uncharacterized protein n=1 Tax=Xylanibacillus composti TaxID=1572762 RepID=A0A8J4H387_9BACL|nr:hypothetical protein [Xylanibacillus composti]GIQ67883.1 hypothetical protein XYCOK13_07070 [Xylanibacillus composti]
MLKRLVTYLSKALDSGKEPLEKWYFGSPSIKVSDKQRSSNENPSTKANRKKRI